MIRLDCLNPRATIFENAHLGLSVMIPHVNNAGHLCASHYLAVHRNPTEIL